MRRRRMSGVSPTRSTIDGLTPVVKVGMAMSDYKSPTLTYSSTHESGLHQCPQAIDESRSETRGAHHAGRPMPAARRCTARSVRSVVHVDRVTTTVRESRGDDLRTFLRPVSA